MLMHKIALAGAAAAALFIADTAVARTHHPSTPAERQATDDLNAKALADARGVMAGTQPTASTNPQPALASPSPDVIAPMPAPTNPQPTPTDNSGVNTPDTTTAPPPEQPEQPEPSNK